jgi:3-deoxy-7-phosphoheptulonate synthase
LRKNQLPIEANKVFFIVGPCALESLDQVKPIIATCKKWGITYFRSQIYKPRTHPDSFQGLGKNGIEIVEYLKSEGLQLVLEALSVHQLKVVAPYASIVQIGARNMQNFEFLKKIGKHLDFSDPLQAPYVMLKRGFQNTLEEWLASAKYLEQSGVPQEKIILCERGSRHFASPAGVCLDLALAYKAKLNSPYKIIIDPSHGTRTRDLVLPMALASLSMDFSGLMVEIHPNPTKSWSDADQAVGLEDFDEFMEKNIHLLREKGLVPLNLDSLENFTSVQRPSEIYNQDLSWGMGPKFN